MTHLLISAAGRGVLRYALHYSFSDVGGVELNEKLYQIAVNNFKQLHQEDKVRIYHDNAVTFDGYGKYNVYYFFNPFDAEIYEQIIDKLIDVSSKRTDGKRVLLLCYGASIKDYIAKTKNFQIQKEYWDKVRETSVCIWKFIK